MSQNEPDDSAFQVIDRYITEASTSQPRPDALPLSVSQRLQALGEKKVGTFTPLLDFSERAICAGTCNAAAAKCILRRCRPSAPRAIKLSVSVKRRSDHLILRAPRKCRCQ
jgi:hypothetical protein